MSDVSVEGGLISLGSEIIKTNNAALALVVGAFVVGWLIITKKLFTKEALSDAIELAEKNLTIKHQEEEITRLHKELQEKDMQIQYLKKGN